MNNPHIFDILQRFQNGDISIDAATAALTADAVHQLHHATVDTERQKRTGQPETIFGEFYRRTFNRWELARVSS